MLGVLFESRCTAVLAYLHRKSYSAALTKLAEGEGEVKDKLSWSSKGGHVRKEYEEEKGSTAKM